MIDQEEDYCPDCPLYDSSAFIPSNYTYLNFEVSSSQEPNSPPQLFIMPFQSHFIEVGWLLEQLLQKINLPDKYPLNKMKLSLKEGTPISMEDTLEVLRLKLCRESASGVTLQAKAVFKEMEDQGAISHFIYNEPDFNHSKITKWFLLLNNQEPFSIAIHKSIEFNNLQKAVTQSLNEFYHNEVTSQHIRFFQVEKSTLDVAFSWKKVKQLGGQEVCQSILKAEQEIIGVQVSKESAEWPCSEVESEEYLIFHINNTNKIKLKFSLIANYKVGELLQYLNIQHSNCLGIKIVEQIFPPCKLIKQASKYFKTGDGHFVKNVECRLVCEREMFYNAMQGMKEHYIIAKEMVTKTKAPQYDECRDLAEQRIKELDDSDSKKFTDANEISHITFYTSSMEIIEPQSNNVTIFYRCLNDFLRSNRFGLIDDYNQEWRYRFSASLIRSLRKIEPYNTINPETNKVTVWRGISGHQLEGEKGELYVAKEFLSTSIRSSKAKSFLKKKPIGTLIEIECFSGRPISKFSIYDKEQEVLFMPYTYFRIEEKDTSSGIYYMKLKQIRNKDFKSNPATEILWIDDKLEEGDKVISSLKCPMHTTFLHQIKSTEALRQWIHHNQSIVKNPAIKIAVITNMRRIENGQVVNDAGAYTAELVKDQLPSSDIVFYIRHVQGTQLALQKHGIDPASVAILKKANQLKQFIARWCAPIEEEEEKEEVISETTQTFLSYFNSSFLSNPSSLKKQSTSSSSI